MIKSFSKQAVSLSRMGSRRGNFNIEESIKDNRFKLGAASGFCIGLLFYVKARYYSKEERSRRSGDHLALSRLLADKGRLPESFASLQLAVKENPASLIELGDAYYRGRGTQANPQKAYQCYLEAYEKGESPYQLAMAFHEGRGCTKSQVEAFKLFLKAGMRGEIVAYRKLAELYCDDTPLGISKLKSLFYTRMAAQAGSSESEEVFSRHCLSTGRGLMDAELDALTEQMGQAELDAVAEIVRKEEERREEERRLLEEKLMRERHLEEERLERERILEEERQRIRQLQQTQLEKENLIVEESQERNVEENKTQQEDNATQDREDIIERGVDQKQEEGQNKQEE